MAMIPLKEYALRLGKNPQVVYQKAARGTFNTARKVGRDWFIDEDEPYQDRRLKTGDYVGFRYGYQYQKERRLRKAAAQTDSTGNTDNTDNANGSNEQPGEEKPQ